jgi:MacB-like periplasmic core domain
MGWRRFLRRAQWDRERAKELESYLQIETDENIATGMSAAEARQAAQKKLGNMLRIREEIYQMNTIGLLDSLSHDLLYALRAMRHNLTFTVVVALTLAFGIGANTAVFSVLNSVLLRPLSYPRSEELVALRQIAPGAPGLAGGLNLSPSMYLTYAENNRVFQSLGVWVTTISTVTGVAEPEQVRVIGISDGVLQGLNVPPAYGRWLLAEDQVGATRPPPSVFQVWSRVMLSYGYWQRRFGGDRSVIGRTIIVDSRPKEIVGVMPQGFRIGNDEADLIFPLAFDRGRITLSGFNYQGVARLRPGITIAQANTDVARMVPIWMDSWSDGPGTNSRVYESWKITPDLRPLKQEVVGGVTDVLWGADGDCRPGYAHRVCQRHEFVSGPGGGAAERVVPARGARRGPRTDRAESSGRKRAAGFYRRRAGNRTRLRRLALIAGDWSG